MDTLTTIQGVTEKIVLKSDTLYHKVETISKGNETFFTTDNPIWYVLTLIITGLIAYIFATKQKKNESVTEAKKVFLEKRIEKHNELFKIYAKSKIVTNPTTTSTSTYHKVFETYRSMNDWYDDLLTFTAENNVYLSKSVLKEVSLQNNLRKHIDYLYNQNSMTDTQLKNFAIKYYKDLASTFDTLGKSIANFYEKEINLTYNFGVLADSDFKQTQKTLYSYSIISDNFGGSGTII